MATGNPDLTPEQLNELRGELERTLVRLEQRLKAGESGRAVNLDQSAIGRLSRIEALQNQGLAQNLKDREKSQLAEVVAALKRLEEESYGRCSECGGAVRFERLTVFPEARTCSACGAGA